MAGQRAAATPLPRLLHRRHIHPAGCSSIRRQINAHATAQALALHVPSDEHGTPLTSLTEAWAASRVAGLLRHLSYAYRASLRQLQHSALVMAISHLQDRVEVYLAREPGLHEAMDGALGLDALDAARRIVPD